MVRVMHLCPLSYRQKKRVKKIKQNPNIKRLGVEVLKYFWQGTVLPGWN